MKITDTKNEVNVDQVLDVCFDVSKDKLNSCFEASGKLYEDEFRNLTKTIEGKLRAYSDIARESGKTRLRVVCEPTGGYQDKLLRTARRLGHLTAYVNAESVAKFRVVETNDSGKTDLKDPHIVATLVALGKTLTHRILEDEYLLLRKLGRMYDAVESKVVRTRCQIHDVLGELFCDYSFKKDFLYSNSGRALQKKYGCNPYRIERSGYTRFFKAMKSAVPRMRNTTVERLWEDAQSSVRNDLPPDYVELLEWQLRELWSEFLEYERRWSEISGKIEELVERLQKKDPSIPTHQKGVISKVNLGRLLGESGPLSDFADSKKLLRYAGLNIRMRQSGKYTGQNKISKKGRPLLRKVLGQIVFPLVRKKCLYGDFYHSKRETMPGTKAMTVVMRQFLRKLYGWHKSGEDFNEERFFTSESELQKAAA